jgi:hypothetical protein
MRVIRPGDEEWTEEDDAFFDEVERTDLVLLPEPCPEEVEGDADEEEESRTESE